MRCAQTKRRLRRASTHRVFFEEFDGLNPVLGQGFLSRVDAALASDNTQFALAELRRFALAAQRGLLYFHEYDRLPLGLVVGALLVAWMTLLLASLLGELCFDSAASSSSSNRHLQRTAGQRVISVWLHVSWLLLSVGILLLAKLYGFSKLTHYVYVLLALLTLLLASKELLDLYSRASSSTSSASSGDISSLVFGRTSAAASVGRLLLLLSMVQLMKRAFASRTAMLFSHIIFTLWALLDLSLESIRWHALGTPPKSRHRQRSLRRHQQQLHHTPGEGVDDEEKEEEEALVMRRAAAKLLVDVRAESLVTATASAGDEETRVQLCFLGAPHALSIDGGHLWCLLNSIIAMFSMAPTIGTFTSPTALYVLCTEFSFRLRALYFFLVSPLLFFYTVHCTLYSIVKND